VVSHPRLSAPDEEVEPAARILKEGKEIPKLQDFPVQTVRRLEAAVQNIHSSPLNGQEQRHRCSEF